MMMALTTLLAVAAVIALPGRILQTKRVTRAIANQTKAKQFFPTGLAILLVVGHFSELLRAVEPTSIVHIGIALFLLVVWKASVSGQESELF